MRQLLVLSASFRLILFAIPAISCAVGGVNPAGPVDHSLPILKIVGSHGKVRRILFNYACHCTSLGINEVKGTEEIVIKKVHQLVKQTSEKLPITKKQ